MVLEAGKFKNVVPASGEGLMLHHNMAEKWKDEQTCVEEAKTLGVDLLCNILLSREWIYSNEKGINPS